MSQNQKPKTPRVKIEPHLHSAIIVNQPMVRDFSTGGGHLPGDTLVEGDDKIVTKKWQGYPLENLNLVGKRSLRWRRLPYRGTQARLSTPLECGFRICFLRSSSQARISVREFISGTGGSHPPFPKNSAEPLS